jgi:RNA polymerase sigma factor (sigma-70 family)
MVEMHETSDAQLLRDYATNHSEAAFRELVTRHTDFVYSAALRQVNSPDVACDLTQSVFTDLARKARSVADKTDGNRSLVGWLHRSTRYAALNHLRDDRRRIANERQAMEQLLANSEPAPDWDRIRPALDEALDSLSDEDREALLLRYFKNHDLRRVGQALGVSDDAAQKRVGRAVERLREFFAKRGVTVGGGGLAIVISANAVQAAPVGLSLTISTAAALTGTTLATTATATTIKTIAMTTLQKTIITVTIAAAVGGGIYEARQASKLRGQNQTLQEQQAPLAEQIQQLQRERDEARNQLASIRGEKERLPENTAELLRLRGMAGVARRAIGEAEQLRAQLARQASEATNNPISGTMVDAIKLGGEQQMEGRLSRMTASLHLTAEQAQAARDILMREVRMKSAVVQQGQSGKLDMKEIIRQAIEAGNPDEQIKALLTPDQQAAFPAYRQEEAAHNASLTANQELLNMQSTLGLTAEQTDRVYAALYEVSFNQRTGRTQPPSTNPRVLDDPLAAQAEAQQWTLNQKTKALESVLTPTQLENYRQQQALKAKLEKEMLDKMQGAGDVK